MQYVALIVFLKCLKRSSERLILNWIKALPLQWDLLSGFSLILNKTLHVKDGVENMRNT
jgi:hypothetical protein